MYQWSSFYSWNLTKYWKTIWEIVEKLKEEVDRQLLVQKIEKSSILAKSMQNIFLLSKPKVVYLRPFSSSLPFPKFWKQKLMYFGHNSLNLNKSNFHWLNQWFAFSLIYQRNKYFSLLNQLIFTEVISEIWLIHSNLFLAIWISEISLIISRFWLIQFREKHVEIGTSCSHKQFGPVSTWLCP